MAMSPAAGDPATKLADADDILASSSSESPAATPRHAAKARRPTRFFKRNAAASAAATVPPESVTASLHHARVTRAILPSVHRRVIRNTCASAAARCFANERHRWNTDFVSTPRSDAKIDPAVLAMSYDPGATLCPSSSSLLSATSRTPTLTGLISCAFILAYSDNVFCCIALSFARSALNPAMACSRSSVSSSFCCVTALIRLASLTCLS
mmetsp:Transcript_4237/g.15625  ORF Transcript_4237/g.15625 Transcript_4237/m.15625 type:complete len:211 (+) Transcript_4237:847-1479(+)